MVVKQSKNSENLETFGKIYTFGKLLMEYFWKSLKVWKKKTIKMVVKSQKNPETLKLPENIYFWKL